MSVYLACPRRKGTPRISIEVCKTCRSNNKCNVYQSYRNPSLFENRDKRLRNGAT